MEQLQQRKYQVAVLAGASCLALYGAKKYFAGGVNKYYPDLTGKFAIVTGGTDGIGRETARQFSKLGARVIITGRSETKAKEFLSELPSGSEVTFRKVDFSDLNNIKAFAEEITSQEQKIDILVNNAGMANDRFRKSAQDIELTIAVNHLAPVYLTSLLLPLLKKSENSRIVNLSSLSHKRATLEWDTVFHRESAEGYTFSTVYGDSKMSNILFTRGLAKYLLEKGVTNVQTVSVHPGAVDSNFTQGFKDGSFFIKAGYYALYPLIWLVFKNTLQGTQTTLHCSLAPSDSLVNGEYYADCKVTKHAPLGYDTGKMEECWRKTNLLIKNKMGLEKDLF